MKKWPIAQFVFFVYLCVFSFHLPAAPITWQEFPSDPVFTPYSSTTIPDDYFPCVLYSKTNFDGNGDLIAYKMWHQGPNGIALSYSDDGISWFLQSEVIVDPQAFHPIVVYRNHQFPGGYHYQMWYWSGNSNPTPPDLTMFFTQSVDGVNWTTPIPTTQDADFFLSDITDKTTNFHKFYGFGSVINNPNPTFKKNQPFTFPYVVYYDSGSGPASIKSSKSAISLAYSSDGINWIRFKNKPVVEPSGKTKDWDGRYIHRASVIQLPQDNKYHMFYSGANELSDTGLYYAHGIGHSVSNDGITWKEDVFPIFSTANDVAWRKDHILAPSVISLGNNQQLQMWFSGGKSSYRGSPQDMHIGYAISTNLFDETD